MQNIFNILTGKWVKNFNRLTKMRKRGVFGDKMSQKAPDFETSKMVLMGKYSGNLCNFAKKQ
jgi:hypothetical protein